MGRLEASVRVERAVAVAHAEAFQLMLYRAEDGAEVWIWNSRDGVTPFGTSIEGKDYRHAMNSYWPRFQAVLPEEAEFVWVTYDRAAWEAMERGKFDQISARDDSWGEEFRTRYPTIEGWLAVAAFEHGQPRKITRAEYLAATPEWMGNA